MDAIITAGQKTSKPQVRANELIQLLDHYANDIEVLSLDCFDTIIWRKTATPSDVFYDMQTRPTFAALDFTALMRMRAEGKARDTKLTSTGLCEVTLHDIYTAALPKLSQEQIEALTNDEIAAELDACYPFPPLIELIRAAHARGLKIIIVSDTYLHEPQLRKILEKHLPTDVIQAISTIFCSSEHQYPKRLGLFNIVLDKLHIKPESILHIGDNFIADYAAARQQNINAAQLIYNEEIIAEITRMQALASTFIDGDIRRTRSLPNPFRAVFATTQIAHDEHERIIGYASAGPILYAFAKFIIDEYEQLIKAGKKTKILFLMRDAYLPSLVCEAIKGKQIGHRVCISRFAANAASFLNRESIDRYLTEVALSGRFADICHQLLIPEKTAAPLIKRAQSAQNPAREFIKLVQQKNIQEIIIKKSNAYRKRLFKHLENEAGLEKGDTLLFVDLGYTGTAQLLLEPIFKQELDVDIVGRYLIQLHIPEWRQSRRGLMDPSWCDDRALLSLVAYIALLEQICTSNDKSVIDYDEQGQPIYSQTSVGKSQHKKLKAIQDECVRFAHDVEHFIATTNIHFHPHLLRDTAMASLMRMLFLPTQSEIDYLQSFKFDLNLGTKDLIKVFDAKEGLIGLRKRGMYFMEKNLKSMRTNYPAELRSAGLELAITLMAQHRFDFDVRVKDLSLRRENLQVVVMREGHATEIAMEAIPTHDGYFSLQIPIANASYNVGILFGKKYRWVQLESAEVIMTDVLYSSKESQFTEDASTQLAIDQMQDHGGGLFECKNEGGLLMFSPRESKPNGNHVLRVVFRPVVVRDEQN